MLTSSICSRHMPTSPPIFEKIPVATSSRLSPITIAPDPFSIPFATTISPSSKYFINNLPICFFQLTSPAPNIMDTPEATRTTSVGDYVKKSAYSVWAVPPEDVRLRLKKLMDGLRSEFDGPQFEPHVTVVGETSLTERDALDNFQSACGMVKAYTATVDRVATGTFFYQCVYLLLHPTTEVVDASSKCSKHFQYRASSPYMPHLSLLYGDLTDDEKRKAQEKANILDEGINGLSFPITRLALWKVDTGEKKLLSWEKVAECDLSPD